MKCERCKKEFDQLHVFSPYGHNNALIKAESEKNNGYCEKCFDIKLNELGGVVNVTTGDLKYA